MAAITLHSTSAMECSAQQAQLSQEFPDWHIWISRGGRWWATRRGNARLSRHHDSRWSMTVDADTPDELRKTVQLQQGIS